MTHRFLAKLALAVCIMAGTALPARAALITVTSLDGVNLSYTTSVFSDGAGGAILDVTFNSLNLVSKVNGNTIIPLNATFTDLVMDTGPIFSVAPPPNVGFNPSANNSQYGIADFSGVVFDYQIGLGTTNSNNLSLTGIAFLDPSSPSSTYFDSGSGNTYDFSPFYAGPPGPTGSGPGEFFMSLNASTGDIIASLTAAAADPNAGDQFGSFSGSASFSQLLTPEPSSMVLLGIGGVVTFVARRRRKA